MSDSHIARMDISISCTHSPNMHGLMMNSWIIFKSYLIVTLLAWIFKIHISVYIVTHIVLLCVDLWCLFRRFGLVKYSQNLQGYFSLQFFRTKANMNSTIRQMQVTEIMSALMCQSVMHSHTIRIRRIFTELPRIWVTQMFSAPMRRSAVHSQTIRICYSQRHFC